MVNFEYGLFDPDDPINRRAIKVAKNLPKDKKEFIKGLANESQEINLLKNCQPIADKPTLIMKGDLSILVTEEDLLEMKEIFKKSVVAIFPESGHDVSAPDYDLYIQTINNFIKRYPELT